MKNTRKQRKWQRTGSNSTTKMFNDPDTKYADGGRGTGYTADCARVRGNWSCRAACLYIFFEHKYGFSIRENDADLGKRF
jgi:hypothetical protein